MSRLYSLYRPALVCLAVCVGWLSPALDATAHRQSRGLAPDRFQLLLPVTAAGLRDTLVQMSVRKRTAFGIEIVRGGTDRTAPRDRGPRLEYAVDLTGLTVPAMLDRIVSVKGKDTTAGLYEWTEGDAVYSVRPAVFRNNRAVALSGCG